MTTEETDQQAERLQALADAGGFQSGPTRVYFNDQLIRDLRAGARALRDGARERWELDDPILAIHYLTIKIDRLEKELAEAKQSA